VTPCRAGHNILVSFEYEAILGGRAMGIQHARKELRTANKRRRKKKKHKLRSTKKYKG